MSPEIPQNIEAQNENEPDLGNNEGFPPLGIQELLENSRGTERINTLLEQHGIPQTQLGEIYESLGEEGKKIADMVGENIRSELEGYNLPEEQEAYIQLMLFPYAIEATRGVLGHLENSTQTGEQSEITDQEVREKVVNLDFPWKETILQFSQNIQTLQDTLNGYTPELTNEEKENVFSHLEGLYTPEYFSNPNIGGQVQAQLTGTFIQDNRSGEQAQISEDAIEDLAEHLSNTTEATQSGITNLQEQLHGQLDIENFLPIITSKSTEGKILNTTLTMLLKIPILGSILAGLLGLEGDDLELALENEKKKYEIFSYFQNGNKQGEDHISQLKGMDTSELRYSKNKKTIGAILELKPDLDAESLWNNAFTSGVTIKEAEGQNQAIVLKLDITNAIKSDGKISNDEFKAMLEAGTQEVSRQLQKRSIQALTGPEVIQNTNQGESDESQGEADQRAVQQETEADQRAVQTGLEENQTAIGESEYILSP